MENEIPVYQHLGISDERLSELVISLYAFGARATAKEVLDGVMDWYHSGSITLAEYTLIVFYLGSQVGTSQ